MCLAHGFRYELVKGELVQTTLAGSQHGYIAGRLLTFLGHHVLTNQLGEVFATETGFKLESAPDTVRAPDISFIAKSRLPSEAYWPIAPDLVAEIISPHDISQEVQAKVNEYLYRIADLF